MFESGNIDHENGIIKHNVKLSNSIPIRELAINIRPMHQQFILAIYNNKEMRSNKVVKLRGGAYKKFKAIW